MLGFNIKHQYLNKPTYLSFTGVYTLLCFLLYMTSCSTNPTTLMFFHPENYTHRASNNVILGVIQRQNTVFYRPLTLKTIAISSRQLGGLKLHEPGGLRALKRISQAMFSHYTIATQLLPKDLPAFA